MVTVAQLYTLAVSYALGSYFLWWYISSISNLLRPFRWKCNNAYLPCSDGRSTVFRLHIKELPLLPWMQTPKLRACIVQGGPKKPDCFSDLITLWRLVLERRAVCQNFRDFIEKKVQNWHFSEFKYSLPNLLKSSQQLKLCCIWPEHMDFTQFTLTYSETTVIFPQS